MFFFLPLFLATPVERFSLSKTFKGHNAPVASYVVILIPTKHINANTWFFSVSILQIQRRARVDRESIFGLLCVGLSVLLTAWLPV